MKISYNWLKEYIPITQSPEEISEILTAIGLEVEGLEEKFAVPGGLQNIVIGEVLEAVQHPNADRLKVCQVRTSSEDQRQIVCGAPNVDAGQKVVVALPGAMIYTDPDKPFEIKKGKIRGEESNGMICAEDELGLGTSHDGIMVLDVEAKIGQPAAEYFELETDYVYDIGLTPNRSDATSHLGVARDLLAYLQIHHQVDTGLTWPTSRLEQAEGSNPITVRIADESACPVYAGATLREVKIGDSPQWLKQRLESIGVRSINNVVDITNFVLHEYGQPLHAFDLAKIANKEVRVQFLPKGTKFLTLDEKEIELLDSDLIICDGEDKPMCLAGVFGGSQSGVTENTTALFLESAHFDAKSIRRSSMFHNLRTDAAQVFEKGSDPKVVMPALKRACEMMVEYAGARIDGDVSLYADTPKPMPTIRLRWAKVDQLIGIKIPRAVTLKILETLEFELGASDDEGVDVIPSSSRADVLREVDVIEEILRIYGFNQVPIPAKASFSLIPEDSTPKHRRRKDLSSTLASWGYHEIMGLSLVTEQYLNGDPQTHVKINNTSNQNLDTMRSSVLVSGLESIRYNLNRGNREMRLFEFGREYKVSEAGYHERELLCLFQTGGLPSNWTQKPKSFDFYSLKSDILLLLERLGVYNPKISDPDSTIFQYGIQIAQGPTELASFGLIHPDLLERAEVGQKVYGGYIDMDVLLKRKPKDIVIQEPSKFPGTSRDLALKMDQTVNFAQVEAICNKIAKKILDEVTLFDLYVDEAMEAQGQKSYAIRLSFSNPEKTLKDKEVDKIMQKIIHTLESNLGVEVRR